MNEEVMMNAEKTPTLWDLIVASCGRDDINEIPKASVILYTDIFHMDGSEPTNLTSMLMITPEVNIFRHATFSTVDLKFDTKYNKELVEAFDILEKFKAAENSMDDDAENIPVVRIGIIPNDYNGRYYIMATNPALWHLAPAGIDGEPRVLTFAVRDEDLLAYDSGEDDYEEDSEEDKEVAEEVANTPIDMTATVE